MNKNKKTNASNISVVELISWYPGMTATELAHTSGRNVNSLSSRLTKLATRRTIKRKLQGSAVRKAKAYRYYPKPQRA